MKRIGFKKWFISGSFLVLVVLLMQVFWFSDNTAAAGATFNVTANASPSQISTDKPQVVHTNLSIYNKNAKPVYAVPTVTIVNPAGKQISTITLPGRSFPGAATTNISSSYTLPSTPATGKYTVSVRVQSSNPGISYFANSNLTSFTVSNPTRALPTIKPTVAAAPAASSKIIFGMGSEADGALLDRIVKEAPVKMLTSWYNRPSDLAWMTGWKNSFVPQTYAKGYSLHLIVYSDDASGPLNTPYGPACGKAYPLSSRFLGDMTQLAQTFAGNGTVYVTFFSEFQMYSCTNNQWTGSENYFRALQDQYMAALKIFHQYAPNSKVSLGWGGWQARWDDPAVGGGRSLFPHFANVMRASDFQSFQAMQNDTNVKEVLDMTTILGAYGPVMLAHQKPDNGSQQTFDNDVHAMLTDSFMAQVTKAGLFAWSFMDNVNLSNSESTYQFVKSGVAKYGR